MEQLVLSINKPMGTNQISSSFMKCEFKGTAHFTTASHGSTRGTASLYSANLKLSPVKTGIDKLSSKGEKSSVKVAVDAAQIT
mmetsp:Transcript_39188/g.65408  ORF Transcript_39188/g.65408 Transcript_39188/m.65408 type:complete len:83 (-) Transcript_39188:666-914(-)